MSVGSARIGVDRRLIGRCIVIESHLIILVWQMIKYTYSCDHLVIKIVDDKLEVSTPFWSSEFEASFKDLGGRLNNQTGNFEIWATEESEVRDLLLYYYGSDADQDAKLVDVSITFAKQLTIVQGRFSFAGRKVIEVDQKDGQITFAYGVRLDCEECKISSIRRNLHWELKFHRQFSFVLRDVSSDYAKNLVAAQTRASVTTVSIRHSAAQLTRSVDSDF